MPAISCIIFLNAAASRYRLNCPLYHFCTASALCSIKQSFLRVFLKYHSSILSYHFDIFRNKMHPMMFRFSLNCCILHQYPNIISNFFKMTGKKFCLPDVLVYSQKNHYSCHKNCCSWQHIKHPSLFLFPFP